jgi:hypothetical protein
MDNTPNQVQVARSSFVTALAWVFIVLSGFATLIAVAQNVMINTMFPVDQMEAAMHSAKTQQDIPPIAKFMTSHFRLFFGAFLALSVVTLVSSISLLKRKNWARLIFISLMGLGIVWNIGGLFLQQAMFSTMPPPPTTAPPEFQNQFNSMAQTMMIFSAIMAIGFSVLFAWIIKRLASQKVREEFEVAL